MEQTGRLFGDYRIVIYESDSTDGTAALLTAWQQSDPERITVISEVANGGGVRERIDRTMLLADMRNRLMAVVRGLEGGGAAGPFAPDVVVIGDLDYEFGWDVRGIASVFRPHDTDEGRGWLGPERVQPFDGDATPETEPRQQGPGPAGAGAWPHDWDSATAFGQQLGSGFYWDWAALRLRGLANRNVIEDRGDSDWYGELKARLAGPGQPWLPVRCAFGGLAVYRADAVRAGGWKGDSSANGCEHIGLCERMAESGFRRHFVVPSLVQLYDVKGGGKGWLKRLAEAAGWGAEPEPDGAGLRVRARSGPVSVSAGKGQRLRLPGAK